MQPIKRFAFDAAIIFSDILVIPDALGQTVSFESGTGPKLNPIESEADIKNLCSELDIDRLSGTIDAIAGVRQRLDDKTSLIGFCGAPWTVASYMIAGKGSPDQAPARVFAYKNPQLFQSVIDILVRASVRYLREQINCGADVIQIFDSWAGVLPDLEFRRWCIDPIRRIVEEVRLTHKGVKIILFSRGAGVRLVELSEIDGIDCLGVDTAADAAWVSQNVQPKICVQGNLDPLVLLAGGAKLEESIKFLMASWSGNPFIFNLGHGILPDTPIENVELLVDLVRDSNGA